MGANLQGRQRSKVKSDHREEPGHTVINGDVHPDAYADIRPSQSLLDIAGILVTKFSVEFVGLFSPWISQWFPTLPTMLFCLLIAAHWDLVSGAFVLCLF